jgi:prepilin-type N-terminal cleavage/methylation domain-containing protein
MLIKKLFNSRRGFTLIEILVAVAVLGAAMITVAQMFRVGLDVGGTEEKRMVALNLLQHELEILKEKEWSSLQSKSRSTVDGYEDYEIAIMVSNYSASVKIAQGRIYWTDHRGYAQSEILNCMYADHLFRVEPSNEGVVASGP